VTRFDDLGLAGYERGTGYRSGGAFRPADATLRGFVRGAVLIALGAAAVWLLWDVAGGRIARAVGWLALAAAHAWRGWRDRRHPLAGDEYATDEEREKVRRDSSWTFAFAGFWAVMAVLAYVSPPGHDG
jgi:hypothetical protein